MRKSKKKDTLSPQADTMRRERQPSEHTAVDQEIQAPAASSVTALLTPERFIKWLESSDPYPLKTVARFVDEERHRARIRGDKTWTPNIFCTDAALRAAIQSASASCGLVARLDRVNENKMRSAALAWRATKYVARFDADIYDALLDTPLDAQLPAEAFERLPGYSVFIETPGFRLPGLCDMTPVADEPGMARFQHLNLRLLDFVANSARDEDQARAALAGKPFKASGEGEQIEGFFATLTTRSFGIGPEAKTLPALALLAVDAAGLVVAGVDLPLIKTLEGSARHLARAALTGGDLGVLLAMAGVGSDDEEEIAGCLTLSHMRELRRFAPLFSLVLYLCSKEPEFDDGRGFVPPPAMRLVGNRLIVKTAEAPTVRTLGARMGAAFRLARAEARSAAQDRYAAENGSSSTAGVSPRHKIPHLRAAHWHSYWTGPRKRPGEQKPIVHWIPPTLVNVPMGGEAQTAIRPVRALHESNRDRVGVASPRSASAA